MNSLRIIGRKLAPSRRVKVRVAPKVADGVLHSPQHRAFRLIVCRRAGWRCEWVEDGQRCTKSAASGHRVIADHIVERADGGALFDPANGQCLCVQHNTLKGTQARAARRSSPGGAVSISDNARGVIPLGWHAREILCEAEQPKINFIQGNQDEG